MGFGELAVVVLVGLVIFGPKELPKVLRKLGQWAGKLRRMAADLRAQSGIDEALHAEGLAEPIREIQKLTRGELDGVVAAARSPLAALAPAPAAARGDGAARDGGDAAETDGPVLAHREREYPTAGCDAYGALPDGAVVYQGALPASPLAADELYARGEDLSPAAFDAKVA